MFQAYGCLETGKTTVVQNYFQETETFPNAPRYTVRVLVLWVMPKGLVKAGPFVRFIPFGRIATSKSSASGIITDGVLLRFRVGARNDRHPGRNGSVAGVAPAGYFDP
jgi:hypothetical protein